MKKLFSLFICLLLMSCYEGKRAQVGSDGQILKNGQFYDSQEAETNEVWICLGKSSHAYHSTNECYGIEACGGEKQKVSLDKALSMGRTPCHYCHQESEAKESETSHEVYVCTGGYATKYHRPNCSILKKCKDDLEKINDPEEAEDLGYEPCRRCCK